jgi:predicted SnoaL-like aldol condensation-catalyzing enzyme
MGKDPARITDYIGADGYARDNPMIKDGLRGVVEAVEALVAQSSTFKDSRIHRVPGEGNFVLTVGEGA